MNTDPVEMLRALLAESDTLLLSTHAPQFVSWKARVYSTLSKVLPRRHYILDRFVGIEWYRRGGLIMSPLPEAAIRAGIGQVKGLIDAAIFELEQLAELESSENTFVDAELWIHTSDLVTAEEWGKVASQTAIFTEDRIRKWTGRPPGEVGEGLMTAVFGDRGEYRLGLTEGEKRWV